ncbi:MAG: hypothetical protein KDE34_26515 [Anaerolineales bacterium]|nr:hypothetical protein [Anaerolineales bacterium]
MIYQTLRQYPELFQAMTGLTIHSFDALHDEIKPLWQEAENAAKKSSIRLRRIGAGRKYGAGFRERLLVACLCERRLLPTAEIAALFSIHPSTVNRYHHSLRDLIQKKATRYRIGKRERRGLAELTDAFPVLAELDSVPSGQERIKEKIHGQRLPCLRECRNGNVVTRSQP